MTAQEIAPSWDAYETNPSIRRLFCFDDEELRAKFPPDPLGDPYDIQCNYCHQRFGEHRGTECPSNEEEE